MQTVVRFCPRRQDGLTIRGIVAFWGRAGRALLATVGFPIGRPRPERRLAEGDLDVALGLRAQAIAAYQERRVELLDKPILEVAVLFRASTGHRDALAATIPRAGGCPSGKLSDRLTSPPQTDVLRRPSSRQALPPRTSARCAPSRTRNTSRRRHRSWATRRSTCPCSARS